MHYQYCRLKLAERLDPNPHFLFFTHPMHVPLVVHCESLLNVLQYIFIQTFSCIGHRLDMWAAVRPDFFQFQRPAYHNDEEGYESTDMRKLTDYDAN